MPTTVVAAEGGGVRCGAFECGVTGLSGAKAMFPAWESQDTHLVMPLADHIVLAAVFDGHGEFGGVVAARSRELIAERAKGLGSAGSHVVDALYSVFESVHVALEREGHAQWSGTTATVGIIDAVAGSMTVAHVGDSRLIVAQGPQVTFATADHVIDVVEELRIEALGGEVRMHEVCGINSRRVFQRGQMFPGLSMSRSLGDVVAHQLGVRATPAVYIVPLQPASCIILASDGVWHNMESGEVAALADKAGSAPAAARRVATEAWHRWPEGGDVDDVTVVVVRMPIDMPTQAIGANPQMPFD